ncbi:MAG: diguanylate cyclase [Clostridium sp.]|nr:diguanylate cyclase [Clostridium sp.]
MRDAKYSSYKSNTEYRLRSLEEKLDLTEDEFVMAFIERFESGSNPEMWASFLYDRRTNEVLYDSSKIHSGDIDSTERTLKETLSSYVVIEKEHTRGVFGVSKFYIDELIKEEMGEIIRNRKFSNDSYIWVNEIIDYNGGENYAIRKIHPNLIDSEGSYLSTKTEDIKGNLPYLDELNGINLNGEIFSKYYFKKLDDVKISEKIAFAKLYKDFDWVIAMGVHLDEIDEYTEQTNNEIREISSGAIIGLLKYIFLILLIGFIILYLIEKNHISASTKSLEKEMNIDLLTKASSRRCGSNNLSNLFQQYKLTGENPAIMMFDVDDFKEINDKFGHNVGDNMLVEIVSVINMMIRSSDQLIRWGGDEFIGIFPGLKEEHVLEFGQKIIERVSMIQIPVGHEMISVTISIGYSFFKDSDSDFSDVLKRADYAMYQSKEDRGNKVSILI